MGSDGGVDGDGRRPAFRRVLLKLSGEALMGPLEYGADRDRIAAIAMQIKRVVDRGVQVAVVIGGGNIYRGRRGPARARDPRRGAPDGEERRAGRLRRRPARDPRRALPARDHPPAGDRAGPQGDGLDRALALHGQLAAHPRLQHGRRGEHRPDSVRRARGDRRGHMSEGIIKDFIDDAAGRMAKSVDATRHEFATVRTGRASPALLDRVEVDYYGTRTPLKQLAGISASEARLLAVTPYDKSSIKAIEKAIMESDVGLTPSNDGSVIRLTIPELTEERSEERRVGKC